MVKKAHSFLQKWYIALIAICVVVTAFFIASFIPKKPELGFSKQLFNPNEFHSSIPNVFDTTISHTEKQVDVTVNREGVSLSFQLPLEQSTIKEGPNLIAFSSPNGEITTEYSMRRDGLKENIILNKIPKENTFPSTLKTQGLITKISAEGIPIFFDKNNKYQFHFERPYVKDGNGAISYAVKYKVVGQEEENAQKTQKSFTTELLSSLHTITQTGQTYVLQVEVDSTWLHDPQRVLPITIDPTIVHNSTSTFATGASDGTVDTGSGATPSIESSYQELSADRNTVGLWHMNEASGNAIDSSGNGNTGTPTGTSVVTGLIGNARSFNGSTDFISIPATAELDVQRLTIEAWTYSTNYIQNGFIFEKTTNGLVNTQYSCFFAASNVFIFRTYNTTPTSDDLSIVTSSYSLDNKWNHIACVYDGSTKKIYINGIEVASKAYSQTLQTNAAGTAIIGAYGSGTSYFFNGEIDEVRVSNVARSAEEIKTDASRRPSSTYTSPVISLITKATAWNSLTWSEGGASTGYGETLYSATNLIAQWNFNDLGLTNALNYAGSCGVACNGTLTGFSNTSGPDIVPLSGWTRQNQRWGSAAVMFNGTTDYITVPANDGTPLDIDSGPITIETWVKPRSTTTQRIVFRGTSGTCGYGLSINVNSNAKFNLGNAGGGNFDSRTTVVPDTWYHVVGVINGANSQLYVNGQIEQTGSVSPVACTNLPLNIGRDPGATSYFSGIIDSTRIYTRALAANEILSNYNGSNIEFQTRVGNTADPTDGTWEAWKPTTSETQINSFDSISYTQPSSIPSLAAWLKADALGLINLDVVSTWNDSSGNGRNFTQAVVGQQPVYMTNILNGKPIVHFTAASSSTMINSTNFGTPSTVIYVSRQTGGTNGRMLSGLANDWLLGYHWGYRRQAYFAGWVSQIHDVPSDTNWHIYTSVHNGVQSSVYEDGKLFTSNSDGLAGPNGLALIGYLGASEFTDGDIAEVIVYSKELSDIEHEQVELYLANKYGLAVTSSLPTQVNTSTKMEGTGSYQLSSPNQGNDNNTIGLWHLDETGGSGAYIKDSSSYANNGTPTGTTVVQGISKKARSFNGSSDYIDMGNITQINTATTLSGCAWVYHNAAVADETIMNKITAAVADGVYLFRDDVGAASGRTDIYTIYIGDSADTDSARIESVTNAGIPNKWNYVCFTFQASNPSGLHLYINGVEDINSPASTSTVAAIDSGVAPFRIGAYSQGGSNLNGYIDEVKISNVVLSPREISEGYAMGRNKYLNLSLNNSDLSSKTIIPFYIAADRPGSYLSTMIGESSYANYQPDVNTAVLLHLDNIYQDTVPSVIQMSSTNVAAANAYTYVKTLSNASVVATGDTLEYDVYLDTSAVNIGTIDIRYSDTSYARSTAWIDQNSLGCTGADLTSVAYKKWYHRKCAILAADNGKTISWIDLVNENDGKTATTAYFDNFILRSSNGTLKSSIYTTGAPGFNVIDITSNVSNTGASTNNVTYPRMLKVDNSSGSGNGYYIGSENITEGKIGKSVYFDGTNYINLGNSTSLQITGNQTIEMWLYPTDLSARRNPFAKAYGGEGTITQETTGILNYFYGTSGVNAAPYTTFSSTTAVTTNKWTHIAVVRDLSAMKVYWYINGIKTSETTAPYATATVGTLDAMIGSGYVSNYIGNIDEVRISNTARSASDIRQSYESGLRSHPITIDFGAKLDAGNLITNSGDLSFTVDATVFGLDQKGSHIYPEDKIIVRENYDGTEYIAQGNVVSVTAATGAITILSWDAGSTFPASGFTANADVFKWQREYWNITNAQYDSRNSVTQLSLRLTDGNEGRSIWLDDLKSTNGYLGNPTGSSITSSLNNKYFQYRTIFTSTDASLSAKLTSVTLNYNANVAPTRPSLDSPPDLSTSVSRTPTLQTTATDTDLDYLRYKIQLCTDAAMTLNCQTFDQTSSQTGWSAQNAETGTAYTTGMQGSYTLQTPLNYITTYYWRSYAADPGGANTWTTTHPTPFSFTTTAVEAASSCKTTHTNNTTNTVEWVDVSGNETGYKIQRNVDNSGWVDLNPSLNPNTVSYVDSTIQLNHSYQYRIAPFIAGPQYGAWCTTQTQTINTSVFEFSGGFNFSGITIQ